MTQYAAFFRAPNEIIWLPLPAIWSLLFGFRVLRSAPEERATFWIIWRRRMKVLLLLFIPAWLTGLGVQNGPSATEPLSIAIVFPFGVAIMLAQLVAYRFDSMFLERRWRISDLLRLSLWNTLSLPGPLLTATIGIDALYTRHLTGFIWLLCAAFLLIVATVNLRSAEGMKPQLVKSGELYKRSMILSKRMGVHIERICVVPFGRGHLTNAYGGWKGIAITDDYGHWLRGPELDFVIGHELEHVRRKHGPKKLGLLAAGFAGLALLSLLLPQTELLRYALWWVAALGPLLTFYAVSRRFEYAADQAPIPRLATVQNGIDALSSLYNHTGAPTTANMCIELFSTHPTLQHRLRKLRNIGIGEISKHAEQALR